MKSRLIIAMIAVGLLAFGSVQAGDATRGEELSADCASCHGDDGKGDEDNPAIAGMDPAEFVKMMQGFKSGEQPDESGMMADFATELSDQDMADLAAYYATLK